MKCLILALLCLFAALVTTPYVEEDNVRVPIRGGVVCALVVRPSHQTSRLPAALVFTIYADPAKDAKEMHYAVDRGYVGVTAYTRGKACSDSAIVPYEDDGRDADAVIEWIAKQPWSDGRVGMYGGSYNGFTQWAAAKHPPAALKTIVPYVANNPGDGLPMQNNVFLPVNYAWIYYVTSNRFLNQALYDDPRWKDLNGRWYASGRAYRDIDAVAGMPNPWLHTWLAHPAYDAYWQAMLPYRSDFGRISIPVLTVTGYYDDGQLSALAFFNDFNRYNPTAKSYLVIGPWDHFGSQHQVKPVVLRGYHIDPVAQVDTPKLTFDWFDYVMRGKRRPTLVSDRINYEVMGANQWRHAGAFAQTGSDTRFYLTGTPEGRYRLLSLRFEGKRALAQRIDFADRKSMNNDSYPYLIIGKEPNVSNGYVFVTRPFEQTVDVTGFDASIDLMVNKRDVDIGLVLYDVLPDGKLMQLSYSTQRASFAWDKSARRLLVPNRATTVPIRETAWFSKRLTKDSRLMLTLNVNKNAFAELNYGTGKDVASETIRDAAIPMQVNWLTDSFIRIRSTPLR